MDDIDRDYLFSWMRTVGEALLKESGRDFVPRGASAFLILEYPTMAGARAAALHIDGIKRMTRRTAWRWRSRRSSRRRLKSSS